MEESEAWMAHQDSPDTGRHDIFNQTTCVCDTYMWFYDNSSNQK